MADTNDTITRVVPQDGWSPIICHKVPITQTITDIVGDKGPNEIYEGGSIKNFHAKIEWQDQYGGSRVPADIISESSDDYGETWTMNEVQEHAEGFFELDYEGHERDFEVRVIKSGSSSNSSSKIYIRYRWLMNGQEITDTDGSLEHAITVTDYPTRLEVDAHYADNFGGHEIGAPIFNSAKIFYKSGAVDDTKTRGAFTKPVQTTLWADKDGWQSQTWSYTENGRTVTAQVGARITALRDVKIEAELVIPYTAFPPHWGPEDGKDYWCGLKNEDDTDPILIFREGAVVSKSNLLVTMTRNDGSTYTTTDYWMPNNYALGRGKQSVTVQKGFLSTTLPVTVAYSTKVEVGNVADGIGTASMGGLTVYFTEVEAPPEVCHCDPPSYFLKDSEGSDCDNEVQGGGSEFFRHCGASVSADKYYLLAFTREDLYKTYYYYRSNGELSEPVTPIGASGDFIKSSFYEYGEYVEPTHYNVHYECYDGTEGFDEVAEIDGEWEGKIRGTETGYRIYHDSEGYSLKLYELKGLNLERCYVEDVEDKWIEASKENRDPIRIWRGVGLRSFVEEYYKDLRLTDNGIYIAIETDLEGVSEIILPSMNIGGMERVEYTSIGQLYYPDYESEDSMDPLPIPPIESIPEGEDSLVGEYGSEVGTLTLGKKSYLYRVGLEPIDEKNYLFIKDFKDIPFNYGLVKCYEPQWEEPVEEGVIEPTKAIEGGYYAYKVQRPETEPSTMTGPGGATYNAWRIQGSSTDLILSEEMATVYGLEGIYLLSTRPTIPEGTKLIVDSNSENVEAWEEVVFIK